MELKGDSSFKIIMNIKKKIIINNIGYYTKGLYRNIRVDLIIKDNKLIEKRFEDNVSKIYEYKYEK